MVSNRMQREAYVSLILGLGKTTTIITNFSTVYINLVDAKQFPVVHDLPLLYCKVICGSHFGVGNFNVDLQNCVNLKSWWKFYAVHAKSEREL